MVTDALEGTSWPFDLSTAMGNKFVGDDELGEYSRSRWYLHREAMKMIGGQSQCLLQHTEGG